MVQAIKFDGIHIDELCEFLGHRNIVPVTHSEGPHVWTDGHLIIYPGEMVVKKEDGVCTCMTEEEFKQTYKIIDEHEKVNSI